MASTAGTQRIVSVAVADIVGSTAIGERLGPERSKFLFDEVVALMVREVRRFDGTVAQLTGDGLLALFGAPLAHEDDAERGVRAALAIDSAIAAYAVEVREAYDIDLVVRVGVNSGPVVLADEGAGDAERYNALGDTVNVAARLQSVGAEGGIVIGPETALQLQGCFDLEPLGEVELRGVERAIRAFRVTGERGPAHIRRQVPIVGRDDAVAVIDGVCEAMAEGSGVILTITGEPGIGKTRLLAEARLRAADTVCFLEGRATSYAQGSPYWPVRELLRDWLGIPADAPEARVRLELKTALGALPEDVADAYPFVARLLGVPLEGDAAAAMRDLSREVVQTRTFAAVGAIVRSLADAAPLCLAIDDLQWADNATLELLEQLLALTEETQLGVILLYRADRDAPSWRLGERARQLYPHRYHELELRPLAADASRTLAGALADAELPASIVDLLTERAGGNPFFLEEALQDLIERGALGRRDGAAWTLDVDAADVLIPTVVQGALQARLDRLSPRTREVVSVASVIGRGFGFALLERLLPRDQVVLATSELMRLDLIIEVRRRPAPEYRFRHGLVQEVAYGSLLEPTRRSLHRRIGEALETLYGEDRDEVYGPLARHFAEADEPEDAARYLLAAGDAARAVYADREAVEYYGRAQSFLLRLGDVERQRDTRFKIALAHHLAFDFARAGDAYDSAFDCAVVEPSSPAPRQERLDLVLGRPDSYAPGDTYTTESGFVVEQLFRGLLRIDRDLNVVPELAQNMTVSDDGLLYLFKLRDDARWSDGQPVTAGDFVFAWERLRAEGHVTAFLLDDIDSAEALDDWTLQLRLTEPRNYFPYVMASHWAYPWPRHRVEEVGAQWRDPASLVSNGPFMLGEVDDAGAQMATNPSWHATPGNVGELRLVFRDWREEGADEQWLAGRHDVMIASRGRLEEASDTVVERIPQLSTTFLGMNVGNELIADERVRLAIAHAIDRRTVPAGTSGNDLAVHHGGVIPPSMPGHGQSAAPAYDPERARALLAEAGYPDGSGLPEIVVSAQPWRPGPAIVAQLEGVGIRARVHVPESRWGSSGDAHVWLGSWHADYPDPEGFFLGLLQTESFFRDEETDALLQAARASRHRDERIRLYRDFERLWIGSRVALVPLTYERQLVLRRPGVRNLDMSPMRVSHLELVVVERA